MMKLETLGNLSDRILSISSAGNPHETVLLDEIADLSLIYSTTVAKGRSGHRGTAEHLRTSMFAPFPCVTKYPCFALLRAAGDAALTAPWVLLYMSLVRPLRPCHYLERISCSVHAL